MRTLRLIPFLALLLAVFTVHAQQNPCLPAKPQAENHLVVQLTPLLDAGEEARLDEKLRRFAQETSNRILVLVVDTLCGLEPYAFATAIGESWGIGDKGFDNGVVVLVKPTGSAGDRKLFIATGRGLGGAIPDAYAKRIVEEEIIPQFKQGRFADGLERGTDILMGLAVGEYKMKSKDKVPVWPVLIFIAVFVALVVLAWRKSVNGYAKTNNIDFWTAMWLMSQAQRTHRGRWGGFTGGGGGGFGGGGGGGFGGFGGGSFGGGGAGGSW